MKILFQSKAYKSWKTAIINADKYPIKNTISKIKDLHNKRTVNKLSVQPKAKQLLSAAVIEVSTRSEIVSLLMEVKVLYMDISEANKVIKSYIIKEGMVNGSVTEKQNEAALLIKKGIKLEKDFYTLVENLALILEDIDKSAWTLKLLMEGIQVASKPELSL